MSQFQKKTGTFQSKDGLNLSYMHLVPENMDSNVSIVINHGIGEAFETYDYLIENLSGLPCDIWIYEMRGHGRSDGKRGHAESIHQLSDDLDLFIDLAGTENKKIILIGHSLGASVSLNYILRYGSDKIKTLIVNASGLLIQTDLLMNIKIAIGKILRNLSPSTTMDTGIKDTSLSSYDEYLIKRASLTQVHFKISASLAMSILEEGETILAAAEKIKLPILITHGENDPLADKTGSEMLYKNAGSTDKKLIIYPGLKHEIYNENKEIVFSDLKNWIQNHL
ncbi:MAG: lysophospholipase [Spirochaetia bacterium]|nr:lysophospholipase [Spirochaetia bacterium]